MLSFDQVRPGALIDGLAGTSTVTILHVLRLGDSALEVAWRDAQNLFESRYRARARTGIGWSSASKPERMPPTARGAAETSGRPPRSLTRPPQWDSQPKLRSTTQRRASTTKPFAAGWRATTRWRMPWRFDHSRQRSAANAPS